MLLDWLLCCSNMFNSSKVIFLVTVLSLCQSSVLNIKNLEEHLRKMSVNYNKTAQTLKSKAENMTKLIQQQPNQQQNQSGLHHQRDIRHQRSRARMCRVVARNTIQMVRHLAEPQCDADGNYESIQCESSGKWCWCVNENGRRVGPRKPLKKLNCSSIDKSNNQSFRKYVLGKNCVISIGIKVREWRIILSKASGQIRRGSYDVNEIWTIEGLCPDMPVSVFCNQREKQTRTNLTFS